MSARNVWRAIMAVAGGELYTDEERDYRDAHPAPVWREFLARQNASSVAAA